MSPDTERYLMIDTLAVAGMLNVFIIGILIMTGIGVSVIAESRIGFVLTLAVGGALLF